MNNLGEEIKKKRLEKGLTIEELSQKTMLSVAIIRDIENESPNAKNLIDKHIVPGTLCVLPKLNNNRIINQDGAFFIFGINHTKKQPARLPDLPNIITIKASAKQSILEELDLMGINEASLFPETDKVMRQIKEEFCGN